jgi:hypothetical protein
VRSAGDDVIGCAELHLQHGGAQVVNRFLLDTAFLVGTMIDPRLLAYLRYSQC